MTKKKNKSTYPSRYSPQKFVHAAQYITELICEKKAQKEKKELPLKFWELPEWLKFYKYQIMLANRLIKSYGELSVIKALRDSRMYNTFSLRNPFLIKIIEEYVAKEKIAEQTKKDVVYDFKKKESFDSNNKKSNNIISKLMDLE